MICNEEKAFNTREPRYHRLLIDLLASAQKHAANHMNFVCQPISDGDACPEDFFSKGSVNYAIAAVFLSSEFKEGTNHFLNWKTELLQYVTSWAFHLASFDDEFLGYTSCHSAIRTACRESAICTVNMINIALKSRGVREREWEDYSPEITDVVEKHLSFNKVGQSSKNEIESFAKLVLARCNSLYQSGRKWEEYKNQYRVLSFANDNPGD